MLVHGNYNWDFALCFPVIFYPLYQDSGPQIPTNVTSMLKYGTNLLQAVGQFNGMFE